MAEQMKVSLRQVSATASEASIREHRVRISRPVEKGGCGTGPMGGDLFLAAVGGCFMSNLLAAIQAREARISGVHTRVTAVVEGTPPRFISMELEVSAAGEDVDQLDKLIQIAERGCIMINTLAGNVAITVRSHIPVTV
jgi:putative redox protein